MIRRREFITLLGGAAAGWPLAARAQQLVMPVVGFLSGGLSRENADALAAFCKGLNDLGYFEGQNVAIEVRTTDLNDQLPALATELVRLPVTVIYAIGNANAAQAAKAATATIPIVFSNGSDPVKLKLVASMNRPGGNLTGVSYYTGALAAKRLDLLRKIVPQVATVGFLTNPTNLVSNQSAIDLRAAARSTGQQIIVLNASTLAEIDVAFSTAAQRGISALLVDVDSFFLGRHEQIVALAARYGIPTIYANRIFARAGGLMSYADNRFESRRQAGVYVGRILKGEKPADLPVLQPTKFELVLNLKTAKTLGLTVPDMLLATADEVIE
jgi:ABC-type uncharacterized transport system substrate-binding protein